METKSCRAYGVSHWVASAGLSSWLPSKKFWGSALLSLFRYPVKTWSRPAACSDVPAALTAKRKDSHSIACRRTDVDRVCKDCQVSLVQDYNVKAFLGRQNRQREKAKRKKNGHDEPNENLSDEKWWSDEKKLKIWLARMRKNSGNVKTKRLECVERFEGGRRSSASHMHSVNFPMDKVGYASESPRGKTSTASLCLALVRSQEQDRHASFPSRSSIVRMAQMVVQWVWYRLSGDRCWSSGDWSSCRESGSESSSAAEVGGFSIARKRKQTGNELVSEMAKIFPPCATKMFPPKPLPPTARFVFDARDDVLSGPMTYSAFRQNFQNFGQA